MRDYIDGAAFHDMVLCAYDALTASEQTINELNVFPVPDGDTGTNMCLTLGSAASELRKNGSSPTLTGTADRVASALLRGARGNSGVILSLLFRGMSKGLKKLDRANAAQLASAMGTGVDAAYKAVMKPAEGTILTVSRLAAEAAGNCAKQTEDVEEVLQFSLESARAALADTIHQNPVLAKAGVVDAGGQGYVIMLDAMLAYLQGRIAVSENAPAAPQKKADFSAFATEDIKYTYCTEFIVRKSKSKSADLLRSYLGNIGDSIVIVEDEEIIKTHVHTNDPGKALTKALSYGALITVKVENMREQHTSLDDAARGQASEPAPAEAEDPQDAPVPDPVPAEKEIGAVCICAGDGLAELFRQLGADGIVSGGQTMNPSTEDILRAVNLTPADTVFVFPNNKNIIMAAEQCAPLTTKRVIVIPTTTVPQGVSAMMRLSPDSTPEALTEDFKDAIPTVHTALVTYAARDSDFDGYAIHAGEYLTLMDGALVGSFASTEEVVTELAAKIEPLAPEFLTVYSGRDVSDDDAQTFCDSLAASFSGAEASVIRGDQPVYYYIISVE